jgi:hypothetical protein
MYRGKSTDASFGSTFARGLGFGGEEMHAPNSNVNKTPTTTRRKRDMGTPKIKGGYECIRISALSGFIESMVQIAGPALQN